MIGELRPRLAEDVSFATHDDGVYVRGGAGTAVLSGRSAHAWLQRLAPFLDGSHTVGDLCASLPDERRQVVEAIITGLLDRGLLRHAGDDLPHTLSAEAQDRHRTEIAFVRQFADSAEHRFQQYCETPVIAVGHGRMFDAWLSVARQTGLRHVRVVAEPQDLVVGDAGAVVHLSEDPVHAVQIDRVSGVPVLHAVLHGDRIWVGPHWESLALRLGTTGQSPALTETAATIAAHHLASLLFRLLTGIEQATEHAQVTEIDPETLRHTTHTLLPHPQASAVKPEREQDFRARLAGLRDGARLTEDELAQRSVACYSDRIGVFREIGEHHFAQFPLRVTQVQAAEAVVAGGLDYTEVRNAANRRAFERYAASTVDKRRFVPPGLAWSHDLADDLARLVPAGAAFPCLASASAPSAVGSGLDWAEAVTEGLLALCRELTVAEAVDASMPFPEHELSVVDTESARYLRALRVSGETVVVHDVTGVLRVPVFAFSHGGDTVTYASGLDSARALREGLRVVLQAWQSRDTGQPEYAPPAVPQLPAHLRGPATRTPRPGVRADELVGLLTGAGYRPTVVPLDHDPAVSAVFPYVVRVIAA